MTECPSSNPVPSNDVFSDSMQNAPVDASDVEGVPRHTTLVAKPPLSPVPSHQSQTSHRPSGSSTMPRIPQSSSGTSSPIGAVASLAIIGGMSQEELLRLGQNRPPPVSIRSTRAAAVVARGGLREGPRRGHHTAPPGTVHIGRVARVTRCDICLSPPSYALCSFNPSPRSSPLHLTRVGGIVADGSDRKCSLPFLPMDQLVRVGPGNVVSTRGQGYARINWHPQPYKSASIEVTSPSTSPPNAASVSGIPGESAISSRVSILSDNNEAGDCAGPVTISPGGQSTSSTSARESNLGSCPIPSTSEEAVHFFGSSYTASTAATATKATTSIVFDSFARHSPTRNDIVYQQRLYHQHIARSVRNLRRYRHIYGDSLTSVLGPMKAPSSEERENLTASEPTVQHRRNSADEALIARDEGEKGEFHFPPSPPSPPSSSMKPISGVEQRRRRRRLFISHRSIQRETQRQVDETIPVATVIVALENDGNNKPSKFLWLHRRCFVHNGSVFLISLTESVSATILSQKQPSTGPPSLCEGSWSHELSKCEVTWSYVASSDIRSIMSCGLLQSSQLHPLYCNFRVRDEDASVPDYTCRMYFLQHDQRLEAVIAHLKGLSAEASESQKTTSDPSRTIAGGLPNSGQNSRGGNLGVAGPPGGFPLMVAAETLAASFGVHMSRGQTGSAEPTSTKSQISWKKSPPCSSVSGASSAPLQSPPLDPSSPTTATGASHPKSSLLRSTFARMRQVATGGVQVNSSSTTTSATATSSTTSSSSPLATPSTSSATPSRSGFHQRLTHFSQTFIHDKSSPRRRKLDHIHRSYQSCQTTHPTDLTSDSEAPGRSLEPRNKKYTQLHLPLTAVLEPNNSFLQSIGDETPVNANELAVTMSMQLAVVDAAMVAASGGASACVEAVRPGGESKGEGGGTESINGDKHRTVEISSMHQSKPPAEQSIVSGLEADSATRSSSVSSISMNTSNLTKELNPHTVRRLLRRPTDPTMSIDSELGDFHEPIQVDPPILYPERSLVGSLPLHQCARSTFSAFVPFVVELCVTLVEKFGLNCVGIYRVSGNKLAHDFMAAELCKQLGEIDATNEKWNDVHALACVLKTLLRNLPDSLIPKAMYPEFLAASRVESWERRLLSVQRLLSIMECYPKHPEYRVHRATLRYLATHLARVASRQSVNRMTAYNLALVFAPNVIQSNEDSPELFIADSKFKIWLLETIIKYHKWVFSPDLGLESGCFVPEDSDQVLLTDEALAEAMAASAGSSEGLEFANQPGRSEGDVRPVLQEMLHAAALLPPPPSTSDLEMAEEPGPSLDKPTNVATVVEQALESSAVELQEAQQQHQHLQHQQQYPHHQRDRPVSQPGGESRSRKQERSLSVGRRREEQPAFLITNENCCDEEREDSLSARMHHPLTKHTPMAPLPPATTSFNPSPNPSAINPSRAAPSSLWHPFHRQRLHSGEEAAISKSTMEKAFVEAGEEIYSISRLVTFRRSKSCRRRDESGVEVKDPPEFKHDDMDVQPPEPTSPTTGRRTPLRVRHHSLRKWWFN